MDKKIKAVRVLKVAFFVLFVLGTHILYSVLQARGVRGALMYGGVPSHFIVNMVSAFSAVGILLLFGGRDDPEALPEDEETWEDEEQATGEVCESDTLDAREAYPELFEDRQKLAKADEKADKSTYHALLNEVMLSNRAESLPAESGEEDKTEDDWSEALSDYLRRSDDGEGLTGAYIDLPDELPEGYVPYVEEETGDDEEEDEEYEEQDSSDKGVAVRILSAVMLFALPIILAIVLSQIKTLYYKDGVATATVFGTCDYAWEDCERFEISPSFFGDRLSVKLFMKDGEEIQLLPSDLFADEAFYDKYESEYDYAAAVGERLEAMGAKKTVREKNTLRGGLALREDIGEYVRRLCDIEDETERG